MADPDTPLTLAGLRRNSTPPRRRILSDAVAPGLFDLFSPETEPQPEPGAERQESSSAHSGAQTPLPPKAVRAARILPPAAPEEPEKAPPQTWTVSGIVRHVRGLVEQGCAQVTVEGEISNWRPSGSGHCYFTIKDAGAQLSAVMFRRQASLLRFQPRDGDAVKLHGLLSIYENRGQLQLVAEWMQQAGLGALLASVQQLKERLRSEGVFDRKRPLPAYPHCIGIVISLQGAALRDIVKVCRRRHAGVQLLIYPAAVQGPNCAAEITAGLRWFSAHPEHAEVVLVARGGGSWEDLHGFDHETVARAIAACALPVITGIGHATDSTVADVAADVCAPTPSAAAELLTAAHHRAEERILRLHGRMLRAGSFEILRAQQKLTRLGAATVLRRVEDGLNRRAQRLDEFGFRSQTAVSRRLRSGANRLKAAEARLAQVNPLTRLEANRRRLERLDGRLERAITVFSSRTHRRAEAAAAQLASLSPLRVLERGYALAYSSSGTLLQDASDVEVGDRFTVRLARGTLQGEVLAIGSDGNEP